MVERCKLHSGVWGKAPADKQFGAYWNQRVQLLWQELFVDFPETNVKIHIWDPIPHRAAVHEELFFLGHSPPLPHGSRRAYAPLRSVKQKTYRANVHSTTSTRSSWTVEDASSVFEALHRYVPASSYWTFVNSISVPWPWRVTWCLDVAESRRVHVTRGVGLLNNTPTNTSAPVTTKSKVKYSAL